jgi:hypothetical protein
MAKNRGHVRVLSANLTFENAETLRLCYKFENQLTNSKMASCDHADPPKIPSTLYSSCATPGGKFESIENPRSNRTPGVLSDGPKCRNHTQYFSLLSFSSLGV